MPYRYVTERQDYRDYASGRVFYGQAGQPAFPIRLASEIVQRCFAVHRASGRPGPYVLHDPLCGGAYLLATLAYWHWADVSRILGSDADAQALSVAERNLGLLTVEGIERRIGEIEHMLEAYGKASHRAALHSAWRLRERLLALTADHPIETRTFRANALDSRDLDKGLSGAAVDIVITDVPYGRDSTWQVPAGTRWTAAPPLWQLLEALSAVISMTTVLAVVADKAQKPVHERYRRVERFRLGTRQVVLLQLAPGVAGK
jgi:hypothetical protein